MNLVSEETRAKMSASRRGKRHSVETLAKLAAANARRSKDSWPRGWKQSEEVKARISAALKGKHRPPEIVAQMKLRRPSAETCLRISEALKASWAGSRDRRIARMVEGHRKKQGICALCGNFGSLYQDHDHKTGLRRDLICPPCNTGLGAYRDDVSLLAKAIEYLVKWSRVGEDDQRVSTAG